MSLISNERKVLYRNMTVQVLVILWHPFSYTGCIEFQGKNNPVVLNVYENHLTYNHYNYPVDFFHCVL